MRLSPVTIGVSMGVCGVDCYLELRRILILRGWVNKGKKKCLIAPEAMNALRLQPL